MVGVLHRYYGTRGHRRVFHQAGLYLYGKDLRAIVTDNHTFFAANQENVALVVDIAHIARMEPLLAFVGLDEGLGGRFVLVIAQKLHRGMDADFAIKGFNFITAYGFSRKAQLILVRTALWCVRDDARGFGHAISFRDVVAASSCA